MFRLTQKEWNVMRSQFVTASGEVIVRAFIALRKFAFQYSEIAEHFKELKDKVGNHNVQLNQINNAIENLLDEKAEQHSWREREKIGFKK